MYVWAKTLEEQTVHLHVFHHTSWNVVEHSKWNWLSYIDEVFSEASPQVLYESCLAVVILQQDKVLHPDPVPCGQGALHHEPHSSLNIHFLQEETGRYIVALHFETQQGNDFSPHSSPFTWCSCTVLTSRGHKSSIHNSSDVQHSPTSARINIWCSALQQLTLNILNNLFVEQ